MTKEKAQKMVDEMITSLGFENKKVILAAKAYDEGRYLAVNLHYKTYKKGWK